MEENARRWKPDPASLYITLGVLAGAYEGRGRAMRASDEGFMKTHLVEVQNDQFEQFEKTVCKRVPTDHIADILSHSAAQAAARPTCPICAERYDRIVAERGQQAHEADVAELYRRIDTFEPNAGRAVLPPPGFYEDSGEQSHYSRRDLEVSTRNDYETVTWAWLKKHFGKPVDRDDDLDHHYKSQRLYIEVRPALGSAWQDHLRQEFTPDGLNDAKRYAAELLKDGLADAVWIEGVVEKYWHGVRGRPGREARRVIDLARWERADMRENAIQYYVWVLSPSSGAPIEGPYGPLALGRAEQFARIGATEGQHDRVVSSGRDAQAPSFRVVRQYQARTGKRLL